MRAFNPTEKEKLNKFVSATVVAFLFPLSVQAGSNTSHFVPASFSEGEKSIHQYLECPDGHVATNPVHVLCEIEVKKNGRTSKRSRCSSSNENSAPFIAAVNKAVKKGKMNPAQVRGKKVSVMMSARFIFTNEAESCAIDLVPNLGIHQKAFGSLYYAPQTITSGPKARKLMLSIAGLAAENYRMQPNRALLVHLTVNDKGETENVSIPLAYESKTRAKRLAQYGLSQGEFIPGFVENKPKAMPWAFRLDPKIGMVNHLLRDAPGQRAAPNPSITFGRSGARPSF